MKKILVVDDNEKHRVLLKDVLSIHGYQLIMAEDGRDGVDTARRELPDLIIMDIQMPNIDGFSAIKEIRVDNSIRGIKVLSVTSFAANEDREKILAAGFDAYMSKPIDIKGLLKLVREILGE